MAHFGLSWAMFNGMHNMPAERRSGMLLIDRLLADDVEKADGLQKARLALRDYGSGAANYLLRQLAHAHHRRTRRTIRLALGELRRH